MRSAGSKRYQMERVDYASPTASASDAGREDNKLRVGDRAAHDWYRFVLSYPPHLVRDYVARFGLGPHHRVLDPFCGTGTTLVECKKLGIASVGVEANPMAARPNVLRLTKPIGGQKG